MHPDLTLTLWETSRTIICRYCTTSWLIVFQLMETRFMLAANPSQQVMRTEYAFCNVVIWSLTRVKKNRINYTLKPLMAVKNTEKVYLNPQGTLCHPWKCSVNVVIALLCWAWNGLWFHCELRVFRFWGFWVKHSELYQLCFLWYCRSFSPRVGKEKESEDKALAE